MPNWCTNQIFIVGPADALAALKARITGPCDVDELPATTTVSAHERLAQHERLAALRESWCRRNGIAPETVDVELFHGWLEHETPPEAPPRCAFSFPAILPIDPVELAKAKAEQQHRQPQMPVILGARSNVWGCKWAVGPRDVAMSDYDNVVVGIDGVVYGFDTPWAPPLPVFEALIKSMDPGLAAFAFWAEPGNGFAGHIYGRGGQVHQFAEYEDFSRWEVVDDEDEDLVDIDLTAMLRDIVYEQTEDLQLIELVQAHLEGF